MKPLGLVAALLVIAAAGAVFLIARDIRPEITLDDAQLVPMAGGHALVVTIRNPGPADRLVEVSTSAEGQLMVAGALFSDGLPIPAGATPSLAMDGAHGMLTALSGDTSEGRLVPVTLRFAGAGTVSTRARIVGPPTIDHSATYPVPDGEPAPDVAMTAVPHEAGWKITLETSDFTFSRVGLDGPHVPGEGHAHLYADGLKLGRIYEPEIFVGALPPGAHEFRVALNTNDHRVYVVEGLEVTATIRVATR